MDACNTSQPKSSLSAEKNIFLGRKIKSIFFTFTFYLFILQKVKGKEVKSIETDIVKLRVKSSFVAM